MQPTPSAARYPAGWRFSWDGDAGPYARLEVYVYVGERCGLPMFVRESDPEPAQLWSDRLESVAAQRWASEQANARQNEVQNG